MSAQHIVLADGAPGVALPLRDYEDLIDARDHGLALRDVSGGAPTLTDAELDAYLEAATPLAFWRRRAGKTQAALAEEAGISQAFLAQMEGGARAGSLAVHVRLARALGLRVDDLLAEEG